MKIRLKGDMNPEIASVLKDILPSKPRQEDHDRQQSRERAYNNRGPEPYPYKSSQFQEIRKKESQGSFNVNNNIALGKGKQNHPSVERIINNNTNTPENNHAKYGLNTGRALEDRNFGFNMESNQGVPCLQINLIKEPNFFIKEVESLNYEEKYEVRHYLNK